MADKLKYTSEFDGSQIDTLLSTIGLMPAYPTEMAVADGINKWGYIKYNPAFQTQNSTDRVGLIIAWGEFRLDQTSGEYRRIPESDPQAIGDNLGKFSTQIRIQPPVRIANAVVVGDADNLNLVCNGAGNYSENRIGFRLFRHAGIQNNTEISVRLVVFGIWYPET